jgi:hypothetical protein
VNFTSAVLLLPKSLPIPCVNYDASNKTREFPLFSDLLSNRNSRRLILYFQHQILYHLALGGIRPFCRALRRLQTVSKMSQKNLQTRLVPQFLPAVLGSRRVSRRF